MILSGPGVIYGFYDNWLRRQYSLKATTLFHEVIKKK